MSTFKSSLTMIASLLCLAGALAAQNNAATFGPQDYSAVMVITSGSHTQQMPIAKRGMEMRTTLRLPGRSTGMYTLVLFDKKTMYMVMPQNRMCMQSPIGELPPAAVMAEAQNQNARITDLGPETISVGGKSYACEHRRMVYTGSNHARYVLDAWMANSLNGFPIKEVMVVNGRRSTIEYQDVTLSPPDASLFVPPAHCSRIPMPMGMPHH